MLPLLNDLSLNTSLWDRPVAIHSLLHRNQKLHAFAFRSLFTLSSSMTPPRGNFFIISESTGCSLRVSPVVIHDSTSWEQKAVLFGSPLALSPSAVV